MNKHMQRFISIFLIMLLVTTGLNLKVSAADEQTTIIDVGPFQDNLEHEYTFTLPQLESITSITSDTGNVKIKSTNGDSVTVIVSGGAMKDAQELTKDIVIDLPISDTLESLQIDDTIFMTNHSKIPENYIPKVVPNGHYPRNENWYRWSQDPVTKKFRWTTDRYEEVGITDEAGKVINKWTSKPGEYVDEEGYKANYSDFVPTNKAEWYNGYITSNGTQTYEPPIKESGPDDAALAGYMYLKVCTYNYTAHVHARGKKTAGSGYLYKLTVTYKGKPAAPDNNPPTAYISAPSPVVLGDDVYISGIGIDPDGDPLTYSWSYNPVDGVNGSIQGTGSTMWFSKLNTYTFNLVVTDDKGATGTATKDINVIEPVPVVNIQRSGEFKENRKIVIDASKSSGGSKRYPIDWSKAKWSVTAVSGGTSQDIKIQTHTQGSTDGTILYDTTRNIDKPLDTLQIFDVQFKKAGTYKLQCNLTNTYGNSGSAEITLNITKDEAPIAQYTTPGTILRDPNDNAPNGYAQATFSIKDDGTVQNGSYSKDGDIIAKRAYLFAFNSDNNKLILDQNGNVIKKLDFKMENSSLNIVESDVNNNVIQVLKPGSSQYETYYNQWSDLNDNYEGEQVYIYDLDYNNTDNSNQMPWNYSINPHWRPICKYEDIKNIDLSSINTGSLNEVILKSTHVGKYKFHLIVVEEFGQEYIPQFTTAQDRKSTMN